MADVHETILRKSLDKIAREQNYGNYNIAVTSLSSDGANFTSKLYLATISAVGKPDLNLFAKVAAIGENFRSQMMTDIFDVEHYVYKNISKVFDRIQDNYQVPAEDRLVMPKFYLYDDTYLEEVLVLQNLAADGFTTQDRMESFSWEYACRSIEELAKFHALSIAFQEDYPEEFKEAASVCKTRNLEGNEAVMGSMYKIITKAIETIPEEDLRTRLMVFLESQGEDFSKQFIGPDKRPVLAHGDFRMSNIMHKPKASTKSREKLEVVIVDYQCVHVGTGVRDLLYFILPGTDEEFRGKYFDQLLDYYYEQLCVSLRRLKKDPRILFPRADYEYEVKKNLPYGMVLAMFVLPLVTVDVENAPAVNDSFDIDNMATVKTGSLYESRLNGLIRDCAKWGVI